ncbi:hypothetical protein HY772_07490 [Candidatus Woesearchaeota archaeon]|nr:hypothetical protein [Candidatus Woesearchaeota archaeon]
MKAVSSQVGGDAAKQIRFLYFVSRPLRIVTTALVAQGSVPNLPLPPCELKRLAWSYASSGRQDDPHIHSKQSTDGGAAAERKRDSGQSYKNQSLYK